MSCLLFPRPDRDNGADVDVKQSTVQVNVRKTHWYGESGFGRSLVEISLADDEIARRQLLSAKKDTLSQGACGRSSTAGKSEPMPACHKALDCTELLEHILQYLSPRDLILSQEVSRTWQSLISSSPTLLQWLFIEAKKPDHAWLVAFSPAKGQTGYASHHTLLGPAATQPQVDRILPVLEAKMSGSRFLMQSELNTVLPWRHLHFSRPLDDDHAIWHHCDEIHPAGLPPNSGLTTLISCLSRIPSKYVRMFLCQPPARMVEVAVYAGRSLALVAKELVTAYSGVTLSHLQDVIRRAAERTDLRCMEVGFWARDVCFLTA